eukprot:365217-Chlamydomonas_euryale.AAC.4
MGDEGRSGVLRARGALVKLGLKALGLELNACCAPCTLLSTTHWPALNITTNMCGTRQTRGDLGCLR